MAATNKIEDGCYHCLPHLSNNLYTWLQRRYNHTNISISLHTNSLFSSSIPHTLTTRLKSEPQPQHKLFWQTNQRPQPHLHPAYSPMSFHPRMSYTPLYAGYCECTGGMSGHPRIAMWSPIAWVHPPSHQDWAQHDRFFPADGVFLLGFYPPAKVSLKWCSVLPTYINNQPNHQLPPIYTISHSFSQTILVSPHHSDVTLTYK